MQVQYQVTTTIDVENWNEVEERVELFFNEGKSYLAQEITHLVEGGGYQGEMFIYSDPEAPETGAWLGTWEDGNERAFRESGPIKWRLIAQAGAVL